MMYVYIAKFPRYPDLIKIGFSEDPYQRVRHLERDHGSNGEVITTFFAGYKRKYVELKTHHEFDKSRRKVNGVGGSEFFCVSILEDVVKYIRSRHIPSELEPLLIEEHRQLTRCMEFSRSLLRKSMGKARKGDTTFNGEKHRICLGVQILIEHGMPEKEAWACYASVLNKSFFVRRQRLTGGRLKVAITCADYGPVMSRSEHSVKYRVATQRREEMEIKLGVMKESYV